LQTTGSRECAPDDRLREASQSREDWIASSQVLLAMTLLRSFDSNFKQQMCVRILAAGYARALRFVVPQKREQGMPDARCTRGLVCKMEKTHTSIQVQRRQSGIPCAMALRLTSRSPRRIGLCCLRRLRIAGSSAPGRADLPSADLTPTTEASGPHDFAVRFSTARQHVLSSLTGRSPPCNPIARTTLPRPPHPIPTFVTMANAPSSGTGWRES
jgi:hypothetical protein